MSNALDLLDQADQSPQTQEPVSGIDKEVDEVSTGNIKGLARKFVQMAASTSQGTTLQGYNNELVKCIEDVREKREELNKLILKDEEDKAKVQKEIAVLKDRLKKVNGKCYILSISISFRGLA